MKIKAVVLAAGESSRFWPLSEQRHKSTIKLCGKPIILWTIESLIEAGIKDIVVVQSPRRDVEDAISEYDIEASIDFVVQKEPLGMGDAVMQTESMIDDYFLVLNPNHVNADKLAKLMIRKLTRSKADLVLCGAETDEPWNYGVFVFDERDRPRGIVEKPEKGKEPSRLMVVGIYLLSKKFFDYHKKVRMHHYSFEHALDAMLKEERSEIVITDKKIPSLKYAWHLLDFAKHLISTKFKGSEISDNAEVSERAEIVGNVFVGEGARIMENAVIKGPAYVGEGTLVGNNVIVREYAVLENNVVVGANAEVARSIFMEGVHVHSGFFGDTVLGENTKVGAGTIFSNVRLDRKNIKAVVKGKTVDTGRKKLGAIVGSNTSIGINCSVMPGKLIGNDVLIGPASLVDENIPSGTRYFTKMEKVVKHGN